LDEAASSLDTYFTELMQHTIETITKGNTSIIIAHRLVTIVNADKIVVMNKGLITEQETHQELLLKTDGYYKNLYDSQFAVAN
jgi:ATP-binding cassette subfamily B multidrug efflux pump